jgi:hypothetical protein
MEEIKLKVSVEVTITKDNLYQYQILAPESLEIDEIRAILAGGVALSIRSEDTPKEQAVALKSVINYLESEFINPDSFSDAEKFRD